MAHYSSSFVSASFGAPPLPTRPSPFHFENLNACSLEGARPTVITQQLIDRVQGQGVAASRNQDNGTSYENTQLQLGRRLPKEFFDMIKELTPSDVNLGQCRLLLPKHFVDSILRSMDRTAADQCSSTDGFCIDVLDVEDNCSFVLRLKHWPSANYYVLVGGWRLNFVTRKGLKEGDKVGLTYHGSKLYFKHFKNHN